MILKKMKKKSDGVYSHNQTGKIHSKEALVKSSAEEVGVAVREGVGISVQCSSKEVINMNN